MFRGQLIKLYILAYLVYRFLTEWIRPEARLAAGLTGYQWAALVLVLLFAWLWIRDARAMAQRGNDLGAAGDVTLTGPGIREGYNEEI